MPNHLSVQSKELSDGSKVYDITFEDDSGQYKIIIGCIDQHAARKMEGILFNGAISIDVEEIWDVDDPSK